MKRFILLAMSSLAVGVAQAQDGLSESIERDYRDNLGALYEFFHANPELSHREFQTSARIAEELRQVGFDVTEGVGGTGVVAVLENGSGPTVMVRADMDGLPVAEDNDLSFRSQATQEDIDGVVKPVMHACGHDVHITSLIGTGRQMMERRDQWSGTLVMIAQPAEERISGARDMLEDGLYTRFPKPDVALAFHVASGIPAGQIAVSGGAVYSSSDSVDIVVHGVGSHGASPHRSLDPVLIGSHIVVALQSVVSRSISPLDAGVITVGSFHSGFKHNIISDEAHLQLTVRSDDPDVRTALLDGIDRVAEGTARALGVPDDLLPEVIRSPVETTPPTVNDDALAADVRAVFADRFGQDIFWDEPRTGMGAEDFAYFVQPEYGVRGLYFAVGGSITGDPATSPPHHSPFFQVQHEPSIRVGTEAMVAAALHLMGSE